MSDRPTYRLGDLQLKIMRVLWQRGAARVAEVQQALDALGLAYTTVATMLRKMEDRGLVSHRLEQRCFVYVPRVTAEEVTQCMADDLVDRLFDGSLTDTVTHLLRTRDIDSEELDRLEQMIQQRKQQR